MRHGRLMVGAIAALLGFFAMTAGASAQAQTVTQAIKAQDKVLRANPEYKDLKHFQVKTVAQAKQAIPKLKALQGVLDKAASTVSAASTDSAKQRTGRTDWVDGVRLIGKGIGGLATALDDLVKGDKSAAQKAVTAAEKVIVKGNDIGTKGDKLLGLPTSD